MLLLGPATDQSANMLRIIIRADFGALWVLLCITYSQIMTVSSDDIVVACGGFVKSDVEINYSLIEVRVQTSQPVSNLLRASFLPCATKRMEMKQSANKINTVYCFVLFLNLNVCWAFSVK